MEVPRNDGYHTQAPAWPGTSPCRHFSYATDCCSSLGPPKMALPQGAGSLPVVPSGPYFSGSVLHAGAGVAWGVGTLMPRAVGSVGHREDPHALRTCECCAASLQGLRWTGRAFEGEAALPRPGTSVFPVGNSCPRETRPSCVPHLGACVSGIAPAWGGEIKDCLQHWAGSFFQLWHGTRNATPWGDEGLWHHPNHRGYPTGGIHCVSPLWGSGAGSLLIAL